MPSSSGKSGENIASDHRKSTKRKAGQSDKASGAAEKRFKTSHTLLPRSHSADKAPMGSRLRVIDLTTPSMFQPSTGAKQLVIKNLKKTSKAQVDTYYKRTWEELDRAITDLCTKNHPTQPLEILFRGVEATCRHGDADRLYTHLRDRCKVYLEKKLLPKVEKESGTSYTDAVRTVQNYWTLWNEQSTLLRKIFSYLDRSYLLHTKDVPQLEDLSIQQFRYAIFTKGTVSDGRKLGELVVSGMCDLVKYDRMKEESLFDAGLLKESILMLHVFGIYTKSFEEEFLRRSTEYFEEFAKEYSNSGLKNYISAVEALLAREALRCDTYNFESVTKRNLLDSAHTILIKDCSELLLEPKDVGDLMEADAKASLKSLYTLLGLSEIQQDLKKPFEIYIKRMGSSIIGDKAKGDDMVVRLLELKRSLDLIIRDSFSKDDTFLYSLREAFGSFMNDRKNFEAWGTKNSKVGEMIAKYMDALLRGGLKAVPRSLLSDDQERDAAEKQGHASTGDEDAELDRQLEQSMELFRFIEGKDVFEAFYKKDLARRLLMARSASQDAERNMLAKFKLECGTAFTQNLEQMFKDQEIARDEMVTYKQSLSNTSKTTMDLQVTALSAAAWPTYPDVEVNLPAEVAKHIEKFDNHYKHKHSGKRLLWKHALAHAVIKAHFNKGIKELLVSAFQAIVLVLFNNIGPSENLSYKDIRSATGLIDIELQRTLQSLACAKVRILTKHPKGREVNETDTFTINLGFTDPKFRIKINQIQLKETKEENKDTHDRVQQDRQYETQAAIVRLMKSRKTMTHSNLVAEVIEQTRKRGAVEVGEIKAQIDRLIDKEYMEREGNNYVYMA